MSFEKIKTIDGKKYSYTVERYREDGRTKYRILEYHGVDKDQIKDSFSIPFLSILEYIQSLNFNGKKLWEGIIHVSRVMTFQLKGYHGIVFRTS